MSTKPGFIRIPVTNSSETPEEQQEPVRIPFTPFTNSAETPEQQQESANLNKPRHIVMRQMPADESTRQRLLQDLVSLREHYSSSFGSIPELGEFQAALNGAIKALINRTDAS